MTIQPIEAQEVEKQVIGSFFLAPEEFATIGSKLSTDDFYWENFRMIFSEMKKISGEGRAFDPVTIYESIGGKLPKGFIQEIAGDVVSSVHLESQVATLQDFSRRRSLRRVLQQSALMCAQKENDLQGILRFISEAMEFSGSSDEIKLVGAYMENLAKSIEERQRGNLIGLTTGIKSLDAFSGGLKRKELMVFGGRPAMGKTAIALWFLKASAQAGNVGAFFEQEMSANQTLERYIASLAGINLQLLTNGKLPTSCFAPMGMAMKEMIDWPVYFDDSSSRTVEEIVSECHRINRKKDLQLVICDNLQIMNTSRKDIKDVIGHCSKRLKELAKDIDAAVVAISHLNRGCEMREDKRPIMSDLRESGAIEQNADIVCFAYRDHVYNPDSDEKVMELLFRKNRQGPTGTLLIECDLPKMRFGDHVPNNPEHFMEGI